MPPDGEALQMRTTVVSIGAGGRAPSTGSRTSSPIARPKGPEAINTGVFRVMREKLVQRSNGTGT